MRLAPSRSAIPLFSDRSLRELEGPAGLVTAGPHADRDEDHALGAGDRAAGCLGVETDEGPFADRHLLAADPPDPGAAHDDRNLLLARVQLVVLVTFGSGSEVEPVDSKRVDAQDAADEADTSAGACALDLVGVDDRVAHGWETSASRHFRMLLG